MTAVMVEIGLRPGDANTPQEAGDGPLDRSSPQADWPTRLTRW